MSDGMLLRESIIDKFLSRYSLIIIDEAHERSLNTEIVLGILRSTLLKWKDVKLLITSATIDANKFSTYFNFCPIFTIKGRHFPVKRFYL